MRIRIRKLIIAGLGLVTFARWAGAQEDSTVVARHSPSPLFAAATPLTVTFTSRLDRLRADRDTNAPWRPATLAYLTDTGRVVLPVRTRTRGIWRLKNCQFPPLRLDIANKRAINTVFHYADKPKLVNFCRDTEENEQYVLQEFQLYRIYQLLTPISNQVRLLRMAYVDSASGRTHATRYAFLVEDPDQMAKRLNGSIVKAKGATSDDLDHEALALAYLFEFMIGNTDFSFNGLHNTQLVGLKDGRIMPVAYDFDYSGAVSAHYATPDPSLRIRSVRERKFRGYCALAAAYATVLPRFHEQKAAIYALYRDDIGKLIHESRVRDTIDYFDAFYEMIATPEKAQRNVFGSCLPSR